MDASGCKWCECAAYVITAMVVFPLEGLELRGLLLQCTCQNVVLFHLLSEIIARVHIAAVGTIVASGRGLRLALDAGENNARGGSNSEIEAEWGQGAADVLPRVLRGRRNSEVARRSSLNLRRGGGYASEKGRGGGCIGIASVVLG